MKFISVSYFHLFVIHYRTLCLSFIRQKLNDTLRSSVQHIVKYFDYVRSFDEILLLCLI
jgi:hypothetical protein